MARIKITDLAETQGFSKADMKNVIGGNTIRTATASAQISSIYQPSPNIVPGHAYTVLGTYVSEDGDEYVTLRNPWGTSE